jgi:hypothetical protein
MDNNELERRRKLWEQGFWEIPSGLDTSNFDFNWRPYMYDRPYVHEFGTQWQRTGGPKFIVPEYESVKYCSDQYSVILTNDDHLKNFKTLVDYNLEFDYSWHPDSTEPPFIWVFGNQHFVSTEMPTIEYHVPGATQIKFVNDVSARIIGDSNCWKVLMPVDTTFDFKWAPHPHEPPYIYVWGNQWNDATTEPTIEYHVPGATDRKYITDTVAKVLPTVDNWKMLIEGASIDQSWRPNPYDSPYIYVWGNKWNDSTTESTVEYHVSGATDRKYMTDMIADLVPTGDNWHILIEGASIDQSWRPNPYDSPYIYVWGNKWNDATTEPTIVYHVPGAIDKRFMTDSVAHLDPISENWSVSNLEDYHSFDFSWRPNPFSPPQIYQWENNGPVYTVSGATEIVYMTREDSHDIRDTISKYYVTTTLEDLIKQHSTEVFWALNPDLNYDSFDFNWKPNENNFRHVNAFGTELSKDVATYYINGPVWNKGFREINYIDDHELEIITDIDMYYVDRGNNSDQFDKLKLQFPKLQKTRYSSSWIDTINRCVKKSTTKLIWVLSSESDYSEFIFDFYPSEWQRKMIHVFGTQWSHWGNTYMINTETFETDTKYLEKIEHAKNINFVRRRRSKITQCLHDIIYIDFGNDSDSLYQLQDKCDGHQITVLSYDNSYVETLTKWVNNKSEYEIKQEHYVWVCSSLCDYNDFDFTWVGDPFQYDQVHVFSSKFENTKQKFGDTFFINLNEFKKESQYLSSLEDYSKSINYIGHISVSRLNHPIINHDHDSQADAIMNIDNRNWPYYELINSKSVPEKNQSVIPNMWNSENHQIIVTSTGSSRIFVPDVSIDMIKSEVYDYPNIQISKPLDQSQLLDIIFISNGEPAADENYEYLKSLNLPNRIIHQFNIQGRVRSQKSAASVSNTDWYFLVNAKLRVNPEFDFSWQPDRLQKPKHYIFMATNPVNHLEYGHQAIVANNKKLTIFTGGERSLSVKPDGLDFTMSSPHEIVDMNSGVAIYNTDSWTTWRTAFRECIKLKHYSVVNENQQNLNRLNTWLTVGDGKNGQWSTGGAYDAIEYYESVNGELSELMKSYDWEMLKKLYDSKYS